MRGRHGAMRAVLAAVVAFAASCGDSPQPTRTVEISGTISAPPGASTQGTVHVMLLHAWKLSGDLRHPRDEIEAFETVVGPYTHTLAYPLGVGEGLLVYAWQDSDMDGAHCTPTLRVEPAGLVEVRGFPADRVTADVELTEPCAGPDWFYP